MSNFSTQLGELVYLRSYARWLPSKERRENWSETVERVYQFLIKDKPIDQELKEKLKKLSRIRV